MSTFIRESFTEQKARNAMDGYSKIWFVEEVNLFEHFCPIKGADDTYQKYPKRSYRKGEFIYFSDDLSDKVFFIHAGAVKIASYTEEGDEVIKSVLHAGEVFGELALFGEQRRTDYAKAMEHTEICVLGKDQVGDLMTEVSGFRNFINNLIGRRIVYSQKRVESLLFKDAKTRITEYVLEQARKNGKNKGEKVVVRNHLTHQEIASFTGTSRQTVTTILNKLREADLIDFNRTEFTILNMQGLQEESMAYS